MPYKISGTKTKTARVMILKESDWSIESNTVVSGSGAYSIEDLVTGNKLAFSCAEGGEIVGFGNVASVYYEPVYELYGWGFNNRGQLGLGDRVRRSNPTLVGVWDFFGAGREHGLLIKEGTLWSCGRNLRGQLGHGTAGSATDLSSPVQVGALTDWSYSTGGAWYSVAIKTDRTLWSWGYNNYGQLGIGDITSYSSPVQVGALTNWDSVGVGETHVIAKKTDGTIWTWGNNTDAELGQGNQTHYSSPVQIGGLTNWSSVTAGYWNSAAIKTDGTLWIWGDNRNGKLGIGDVTYRNSPVQVGSLTNWSQISCNYHTTAAIKTDGTLWSWGANIEGQLGLGDNNDRSSPVQVGSLADWSSVKIGSSTMHALKTDGTLWACGSNNVGILGVGHTSPDKYSSPVQIGSDTDWNEISCPWEFTFGLKG